MDDDDQVAVELKKTKMMTMRERGDEDQTTRARH